MNPKKELTNEQKLVRLSLKLLSRLPVLGAFPVYCELFGVQMAAINLGCESRALREITKAARTRLPIESGQRYWT